MEISNSFNLNYNVFCCLTQTTYRITNIKQINILGVKDPFFSNGVEFFKGHLKIVKLETLPEDCLGLRVPKEINFYRQMMIVRSISIEANQGTFGTVLKFQHFTDIKTVQNTFSTTAGGAFTLRRNTVRINEIFSKII